MFNGKFPLKQTPNVMTSNHEILDATVLCVAKAYAWNLWLEYQIRSVISSSSYKELLDHTQRGIRITIITYVFVGVH